MYIYKITNLINNKIYIGQTIHSINQRWNNHLSNARKGSKLHLYEAIRKYGSHNFTIECIDMADTIEDLNKKEKYWIEFFKSLDPSVGYNNIEGGKFNPMNDITILEKHNSKMRDPEVREKISKTMKKFRSNHSFSIETRSKISNKLKGNQHFKGKKRSLEAIQKTSESHFKSVYCISRNNEIVARFTSVKAAAIWWNITYYKGLKNPHSLMDRIKRSSKTNKFSDDLKWIYEDMCVETIEKVGNEIAE